MTTLSIIPLEAGAQTLSVPLGGVTYRMRIWWRESVTPCWMLDLSTDDGVALVSGLPMLPGADLLAQHKHLGVAGVLYVLADDEITYDSLGNSTRLYFLPSP